MDNNCNNYHNDDNINNNINNKNNDDVLKLVNLQW